MEWRCFHCDEVFIEREKAEEHFGLGDFEFDAPACKLNQIEGGILGLYREALTELKAYYCEDNETSRMFYRLGSEHYVKEREAEEAGYAKGMADMRALYEGPQNSIMTAARALRYLADNPRPNGGEHTFNSAHLYQLAMELEGLGKT